MVKSPLQQLRDGDLPEMVRWYDPRLLSRIFVRTLVSSLFGQYADQRMTQAASDYASRKQLLERYDYSDPDSPDPARRIDVAPDGSIWVDYIADVGDGFEATYTMAYLLAQRSLEVGEGQPPLPPGSILIMGGDQCYPQATREDYRKRLQVPYGWALDVPQPTRKLFAIPGNHDWYDGLNAFDSLFCSSRDKLSEVQGTQIGGWQCVQHRSYWAMRLPHNWWIWGTDIQFSKYLDNNQINYFEAIASQMGPADKVILCIAEPAWLLAEFQGLDEEQNFYKITTIARRRGAQVCAVIAGDWHHYARYSSSELGVHFFTAGGGGAFLHPTHVLKTELSVRWPEPKTAESPSPAAAADPTARKVTEGFEPHRYDVKLKQAPRVPPAPAAEAADTVKETVREAVREVVADARAAAHPTAPVKRTKPLSARAPVCYPTRSRSWMLGLRNLLFPIYNFPFALGIGLIYWLITWEFHSVVRQFDVSAGKIDAVGVGQSIASVLGWMPLYVLQATLSIAFSLMFFGLWAGLVYYVDAGDKPGLRRSLTKFVVGTLHFAAHATAMFSLFVVLLGFNNNVSPIIAGEIQAVLENQKTPEVVRGIVKESLEPLSGQRKQQRESARRAEPNRAERPLPPPASTEAAPASGSVIDPQPVREIVGLFYPVEMLIAGSLIGGFIWGAYWVLTGVLGRMHAEDAFAALRIKHFKNFLRIKIEPHRVTIYPLGVDKVPGRRSWAEAKPGDPRNPSNSALVPKKPIPVHLIEQPVVIEVADGGLV